MKRFSQFLHTILKTLARIISHLTLIVLLHYLRIHWASE